MMCLRSASPSASVSTPSTTYVSRMAIAVMTAAMMATVVAFAQDPPPPPAHPQAGAMESQSHTATVTIPAGTQVALVLTHPIQSRYIHRGDDIYAQITAPVTSGNEMVIPPGTFAQGTVDRLGRHGQRGELRLQSVTITFPDGYVASISGPVTIETNEGYAIKDPGAKRALGALALPAAGAGLGALIGHSVGKADSTITSPFPPGCTGPPPFCTTVSTPVFGTKAKDAIIGAGIGSAVGAVASITLLFGTHHFFIDAGAPVEMTLQQPVSLDRKEVDAAVQQAAQQPVAVQPTTPRQLPPPPPDMPVDHGTCWTPGTPGTPPTILPGAPGPDGIPGSPTVIPGTPGTPGTPYPCP